jgi:hypothetical protein
MAAPVPPFYDWGACPYETCAYREWTAHRSVTVYDTRKQGRRPITQLAEGDKVTGITGEMAGRHWLWRRILRRDLRGPGEEGVVDRGEAQFRTRDGWRWIPLKYPSACFRGHVGAVADLRIILSLAPAWRLPREAW